MAANRHAYVHEAEIDLLADIDPRAVGAAVTVALCGHWEHEGPCLWPHNNHIDDSPLQKRVFRTLFVCEPADEPIVREKIRAALLTSPEWRVRADRVRAVASSEQELAENLLQVPRRPV